MEPAAAVDRDEPGIDPGSRRSWLARVLRQLGGAGGEQVIVGWAAAAAEQVPERASLAQDPGLRQDAPHPTPGKQGDRYVACDVNCHRSEPTTPAQPKHRLQALRLNQPDALSECVVGHVHMLGGLDLGNLAIGATSDFAAVRACDSGVI